MTTKLLPSYRDAVVLSTQWWFLNCSHVILGGFFILKHIEAETKWPPFRIWHFQTHLIQWNFRISIKISLKFVPKGPINNKPAFVQIMAWRRSGDKPLSEPMMVSLLTHIYVTRPQWVNMVQSRIGHGFLNHIHCFVWDVITHPYINFNIGFPCCRWS